MTNLEIAQVIMSCGFIYAVGLALDAACDVLLRKLGGGR